VAAADARAAAAQQAAAAAQQQLAAAQQAASRLGAEVEELRGRNRALAEDLMRASSATAAGGGPDAEALAGMQLRASRAEVEVNGLRWGVGVGRPGQKRGGCPAERGGYLLEGSNSGPAGAQLSLLLPLAVPRFAARRSHARCRRWPTRAHTHLDTSQALTY
jgi:hypothetical protein